MAGQSLYGRAAEVAAIEDLLARARAGDGGGVLVLRGAAGIGKTALLDHAGAAAAGMRVLRGAGVEAEADVPFAALHLLLGDTVPSEGMPVPQAAALKAALGLTRPQPGDRLLVGLALLTLLGGTAADAPVLVLVDDAQWLDRESVDALLFAARRAASRGIVFLFAVRDDASPAWARTGLPELRLSGLTDDDARRMLDERAPEAAAERRARAVERAHGNPLAFIEFAAAESELLARVPAEFERAVRDLPEPARTLLAVVAADGTGEPGVAVEAAGALGVPFGALEPAEAAGLVAVDRTAIAFRHPLARAAAYQGVPVTRRIAVHRALAAAHARAGDAGPRVRHLAAAALGTDEAIAAELESAAGDLTGGGSGPAVAAYAYERAARLAGEPEVRARRLVAAAEAELAGGRLDRAAALADEAGRATSAPDTLTGVDLVRAGLELERGVPEAAGRLLLERAESRTAPGSRARLLEEAAYHAWSCGDTETAARAVERHASEPHEVEPHVVERPASERHARDGHALEQHAGQLHTTEWQADEQHAGEQGAGEQGAGGRGADEQRADEQRADDRGADAQRANERRAGERGADEKRAGARSADVQHANEQHAGARSADEQRADEQGADVQRAGEQGVGGRFAGGRRVGVGGVVVGVVGALLRDDFVGARGVLVGRAVGVGNERLRLLEAEVALLSGDDVGAAEMSAQLAAACRERGLLSLLPRALGVQAWARLLDGAHGDARALAREALEVAEGAGQRRQAAAVRGVQARQAAIEGDEVRCRALSADGRVGDALGLLALGQGRHEDALEHLQDAHREAAAHVPNVMLALADTVEAAVAAGRPAAGAEPMARLEAFARNAGQPWADGVASRCRALLTGDEDEAERHFTLALAAHRRGGRPFERARTELLYGEWLRRSRRRAQARARLGAALEIFERLGAVPWAERARGELRAAGQGVRPAGDGLPGRLTAQEMQVVRLAMTGATNRQIAARLRLSHRTVAYHLYKAFPKLGVASRAELHRCVPPAEAGAERPA
ncbi:AAA family ATPase [Actinomadura welshii]